jgi:hypothetical protein
MSREKTERDRTEPQSRDDQATSSETLKDIEEAEEVAGQNATDSSSTGLDGASPRPDSESSDRADGSDRGGPM